MKTNKYICYYRVSTKEQEENQSLDVQLETCEAYAERYNLNIVRELFGEVFESAKTDKERKEFNKMLTFIRRNKKLNIKYVVVYNTKRFSRTGSITIIEELESMGIIVLSAMSNYNPKTAAGKFCQRMELATANFENEEKAQTTRDLSRAALLKGRWVGKAPRGYDPKTTKKQQTITINKEGEFIRKAFEWKANEKLTNQEIIQRLAKLGYHITKQKISEVFKDYLSNLSVNGISKDVFEKQLTKVFNNQTKQDKLDTQQMKTEVSKLRTQLKTLESNWALETHSKKKDVLWNNIENTENRIVEIENEIDKHENSMLNLHTYLKHAINMVYNPLGYDCTFLDYFILWILFIWIGLAIATIAENALLNKQIRERELLF